MDDVGMDLFERNKVEIGRAEGGLDEAAVFQDVFFGVPVGETEIQNLFALEFAHAAGPRAESVDQPRDSCQSIRLKYPQATDFVFGPRFRGRSSICLFAARPCAPRIVAHS